MLDFYGGTQWIVIFVRVSKEKGFSQIKVKSDPVDRRFRMSYSLVLRFSGLIRWQGRVGRCRLVIVCQLGDWKRFGPGGRRNWRAVNLGTVNFPVSPVHTKCEPKWKDVPRSARRGFWCLQKQVNCRSQRSVCQRVGRPSESTLVLLVPRSNEDD